MLFFYGLFGVIGLSALGTTAFLIKRYGIGKPGNEHPKPPTFKGLSRSGREKNVD